MKKLWQLISTLQILTHYPLFAIPISSNVIMLLQMISDISNLNIIPKEQVNAFIDSMIADTSIALTGNYVTMDIFKQNPSIIDSP